MYKGNRGIIGTISFILVGLLYKIIGTNSKLFGKVFFLIFVTIIPKILKFLIELLLDLF